MTFQFGSAEKGVRVMKRGEFITHLGAAALAASGFPLLSQAAQPQPASQPESIVKLLYESLSSIQKAQICFPWDHVHQDKGLLRTRLENNWKITKPDIKSRFYTSDQQAMIKAIFRGLTHPDWHGRWDQQLKDDVGGFGRKQSIAIFGQPGEDKFEFVLISRHMTLRCDGNSSEHVAFGGPILYAHEGERVYEKAHHPNNVFWHQAVAANKLYDMFDGKQRDQALVRRGMPSEEEVQFRGAKGPFFGIPVTTFSADQKENLQGVVKRLLDPFRQSDQDEVVRCLKVQGGLDNCHLAFFEEGDLGRDKVYDNWRLEGPSFVWYFRGKPHVHVWVNVADRPDVKLNAYQNSIGV
jgi:hypothetical protein